MTSFIDPHAISVYVIHAGKYLLLRRCGKYLNGTWQMISGGIHPGEKSWEAAMREIKEETGLIPEKLYSADAVETFYTKFADKITFVPVFVALIAHPQNILLSPSEHDAYEWLSNEQAKERLVSSEQRRILTHIHENFLLKEPQALCLIQDL